PVPSQPPSGVASAGGLAPVRLALLVDDVEIRDEALGRQVNHHVTVAAVERRLVVENAVYLAFVAFAAAVRYVVCSDERQQLQPRKLRRARTEVGLGAGRGQEPNGFRVTAGKRLQRRLDLARPRRVGIGLRLAEMDERPDARHFSLLTLFLPGET